MICLIQLLRSVSENFQLFENLSIQSVFIKTYFSEINAYLINLTSKIPFTLRNTLGYSKTIEHGPPHQITDGINRLSLTQKQTFHNFCSQTWLFCPLFLNLFTRILVMPNSCFTEKVNWGCSLHTSLDRKAITCIINRWKHNTAKFVIAQLYNHCPELTVSPI